MNLKNWKIKRKNPMTLIIQRKFKSKEEDK